MKKIFEEWGCLVLLVLAVAAFFLTSGGKKEKETRQIETVQSDYAPSPLTFGGYECTEGCSGHEAGYQWAEEQGITDPDECGGKSVSFEEGCQAYAEEQQEYDGSGSAELDY